MFKFILIATFFISTAAFARPLPKNMGFSPLTFQPKSALTLTFDFSGIVALRGCSAAIVKYTADENAKAVVLTNGHCVGMLDDGPTAVYLHKPYSSSANAFIDMNKSVSARTTEIIYGMMAPHDLALLQLNMTYKELAAKGVNSFGLDATPAPVGESIFLASGYFQDVHQCDVVGIIYRIVEDIWTNENSYKYRNCGSRHGTSGSPLISARSGLVIGVNYTGNDSGGRCTYNNPCEVDEHGNVTVEKGAGYGDQIYKILSCVDTTGNFNLDVPGCLLPKP